MRSKGKLAARHLGFQDVLTCDGLEMCSMQRWTCNGSSLPGEILLGSRNRRLIPAVHSPAVCYAFVWSACNACTHESRQASMKDAGLCKSQAPSLSRKVAGRPKDSLPVRRDLEQARGSRHVLFAKLGVSSKLGKASRSEAGFGKAMVVASNWLVTGCAKVFVNTVLSEHAAGSSSADL